MKIKTTLTPGDSESQSREKKAVVTSWCYIFHQWDMSSEEWAKGERINDPFDAKSVTMMNRDANSKCSIIYLK